MAKSGLTHIDVGPELTRTEWESEETHALINGTSFPGSPVERQLFYRNDLHEWYIFNGSAWVSLQGAGGGGDMLKSVYDTDDDGIVDNSEQLEGSTKVQVQDHTPKAHTLASHSTKAHTELSGVTSDQHHAQLHGADHENGGAQEINLAGLDGESADLATHKAVETAPVHGSTATATANKLVHRDANGRTSVAAPISSGQVAIKANVDTVQTNLDSHAALTTGTHGAGGNTLWHGGLTNIVDKTHLSQDFGASVGRLRNLIVTPIAGNILRIIGCGQSPFSGAINGAPTATSVVYDGDTNETMFTGLASGADKWGRIILHNTTRGNSRKVVSVDTATNTITTESSTDDWADDDVITCQSQTNTTAGYFDVDVSAEVPATTEAIFLFAVLDDTEGNQDNNRYIMFHPHEAYDNGKREWINANLANLKGQGVYPLKIISQKFTMYMASGCVTVNIVMSVVASLEYADT